MLAVDDSRQVFGGERHDLGENSYYVAPAVVRMPAQTELVHTETFAQEHLPGARNIPLATFEPSQLESFDRTETLLVYCFDQH